MKFEWDPRKAEANLAKHQVFFEEAQTAFNDPLFIDFYDPDHSVEEERYILVGQSVEQRLLVIAYTERNDAIRLISAREATKMERKVYEEA